MKKLLAVASLAILALTSLAASPALAAQACTNIQSGKLLYQAGAYLAGQRLRTGFDPYGYNYQAHAYSGSYFNVYANGAGFPPYNGDDAAYLAANPAAASHWAWPYRNDDVAMKWNDAWLSNVDCDGDGKLDRHYGFPTYVGSGAWETNHQSGEYTDAGGNHSWNYFVKIVAVPSNATLVSGIWKNVSGTDIGPQIWGEFAITQEVYNDTGTGDHGIAYRSPAGPGVGKY